MLGSNPSNLLIGLRLERLPVDPAFDRWPPALPRRTTSAMATKKLPLDVRRVHQTVESIFADDLHAKRVLSLANATTGTLEAGALGVHAIGHALAQARSLNPKHAVKQVDRLLSNGGLDVAALSEPWIRFVIADRKELLVAMDWTEFDQDDHATIAIHLITTHGRATPLVWRTVTKSELEGERNSHEDDLLLQFGECLPEDVKVTVLADRGFGDQKLYALLKDAGFDFVIRFRGDIVVTAPDDEARAAVDWLTGTSRAKLIRNARVTRDNMPIGSVVCVKTKNMAEPWYLAASSTTDTAQEIIASYGRRFTIEEGFRDMKNLRFGFGLSSTRIADTARRDRILLLNALALALLTILGAAGEATGLDRMMKTNTSKTRQYSLLRQGLYYYGALPNMRESQAQPLVAAFDRLIREHSVLTSVFGII